jgi:hypothetical protein
MLEVAMADYSVSLHSKLLRLRYKYKDNPVLNCALDKVVWFSFPVVYPKFDVHSKDIVVEFEKSKARRKRIRKYIRSMFNGGKPLYLVSLTFGDCYDSTTTDTRRRYAREWLNACCFDYYACLDYGKLRSREHYHAIATFDFDLIQDDSGFYSVPSDVAWSKGFSSFRLISSSSTDVYSALNYAFKCSNYAFKSSDSVVKPFHKRKAKNISDWSILDDDSFL